MKQVGRLAALIGFLAAVWLFLRDHPEAVLSLMRTAGAGLFLAGAVHVLPMLANAKDWQTLIRARGRPPLSGMLHLVWMRETVNCMLPVARIGGEIVAFRLLASRGVAGSTAVASLVVDTQLTLISQLLLTLGAIGYLLNHGASGALRLAGNLTWALAALTPILLLFALVQHANPFARLVRLLSRTLGGKFSSLVAPSARIDQRIKLTWRRRGVVLRYVFLWQPAQSLGTALELWLALYFLGSPVTLLEALVIETLIQAVSSAAFFVPGALGVQEGGFVLIGGALGLPPPVCLALAGARRIRDLMIYVPGLFAWQFAESRLRTRAEVAPALS